jgi:hypothetical protein
VSDLSRTEGLYQLSFTVFVVVLLGALSLLFSRDAHDIMIAPIEKMQRTVMTLSENPLSTLANVAVRSDEETETDMLQRAIMKMAGLLQVGFGAAGASIIGANVNADGQLNAMIPGKKVHAVFGFCDIRQFTDATEVLQEDVMLFVNTIATVVHQSVVKTLGAPNKNIGDAFLCVWKMPKDFDQANELLLRDSALSDGALSAFLEIIHEIDISARLKKICDSNRFQRKMPGHKVIVLFYSLSFFFFGWPQALSVF